MKRFQDLADAEQFVREFLHYFMINLWNILLHRLWMQLTRQIHGRKICWLFLNAINLLSAQEDHWSLEGLSGRAQCMFPLLALLWYCVFYILLCLPYSGMFMWCLLGTISIMNYWNYVTVMQWNPWKKKNICEECYITSLFLENSAMVKMSLKEVHCFLNFLHNAF